MTVRLTDVVRVNAPDLPVTVIMYVPAWVLLGVVIVSVEDVVVDGLGLNDAVTCAGILPVDSVTGALNPLSGVTVIV